MRLNQDRLLHLAKNVFKTESPSAKAAPTQVRMRKRHWALSSLIIVSCSWITHTTTANIYESPLDDQISFANIDPLAGSTPADSEPASSKAFSSLKVASSLSEQSNDSGHQVAALMQVAAQTEHKVAAAISSQEPSQPELHSKPHTIARGESLGIIFRNESLDLAIPHHISRHPVAKQLASIRVGKVIDFQFDSANELKQISYPLSTLKRLDVAIEGVEVASAEIVDIEFDTEQRTVSAEIQSSLYLAAQAAGLSNNLIMEMVRIFGWDIDFVQDIRRGDSFHIIYEEYLQNGEKLDDGNILAAEFTTQGQTYRAIRFEDQDGVASYFNTEGESMLGTFLRSPVEFSRISSRFGKRKHPISKKWKAHKGVDYAAARGTPIRATADGKVTLAGRKGGYGKTVVIRHAGRFSTLYAHMNGYAKGIRSGVRVKQGQTIGYVGSTGMSTGPHLHYEFRVDGVHRNSLTYKTPKASAVSKQNFEKFDQIAKSHGQTLDSIKSEYQIAKAQSATQVKKI